MLRIGSVTTETPVSRTLDTDVMELNLVVHVDHAGYQSTVDSLIKIGARSACASADAQKRFAALADVLSFRNSQSNKFKTILRSVLVADACG